MNKLVCLLFVALLGAGCTASLQNAAKGNPVSVSPEEVRLEVISAEVVTVPGGEGSFRRLNFCFKKTTQSNRSSYHSLDMKYPQYSIPDMTYDEIEGALVYRSRYDTQPTCNSEKIWGRSVQTYKLPIMQVNENQTIELINFVEEAIYVAYENETLKTVGYVSAKPFFTSWYNFTIDLNESGLYTERVQTKPYLLVLTPLTAIADVAAGAVTFGVMGVTCSSQPSGCK